MKYYVIEETIFDAAFRDLNNIMPARALMLLHALFDPKPYTFWCSVCGTEIDFHVGAPGGGWWYHRWHPLDDHDAVCGGYGREDDDG